MTPHLEHFYINGRWTAPADGANAPRLPVIDPASEEAFCTIALGNATLPFMLALADKGWKKACADDVHLMHGLNVHAGLLTYEAVGKALNLPTVTPESVLA